MPGELSLSALLRSLKPNLRPDIYVLATLPSTTLATLPAPLLASALLTFAEAEGLTLILPEQVASANNVAYTYPCRQITLDIHSSLEAVGFMAAISTRLAKEGFSANPVSAYYHDHLFVKAEEADRVLEVLKDIAKEAQEEGDVSQA